MSLTKLHYFQLPSEIEFGDTNMNLQQLPDAYSGGPYYENFDPIVEDNMHPQSLSHSFTDSQSLLASSHFAFVASLVKICTTAVLKHYHSLLPAPSVYIQVQQNLPQLPLSAAMKIMNPQETPQTALLCAEAVEVGRALDSNLSLTAVLDLISHATRGGESASQSEQLLSESQHAARMAPLWDLASELLDKLSKIAQGATLHPLIFYSTPHTAQAFCKKLDDEEAMRHVRSVIPDLCLDVMLANGEWN